MPLPCFSYTGGFCRFRRHRTIPDRHTIFFERGGVDADTGTAAEKEVINITDGGRLGFVGDVDFHLPEGQAAALIIYGPARFFGLFGRGEEYYVPWDSIQRIGDDIILIDKPAQHRDPALERRRRKKF